MRTLLNKPLLSVECNESGLSCQNSARDALNMNLNPKGWTKKIMLLEILLSALIAPAFAVADPNIQLDMQVAKEVIIEENGLEVTRWVDAQEVLPGEKTQIYCALRQLG